MPEREVVTYDTEMELACEEEERNLLREERAKKKGKVVVGPGISSVFGSVAISLIQFIFHILSNRVGSLLCCINCSGYHFQETLYEE